jgi:DNA-binding PadR family transcriptional regulator
MCPPRDPEADRLYFWQEGAPPPPFGGWLPPPPGGRRRGRRGWFGPRARRGDVRAAILALLDEQSMHGYQIIQELESRSGGRWRPSPGSVYPTLQLLEDEGLVVRKEGEGKRVYSLTEEGKAQAAAQLERAGARPWEELAHEPSDSMHKLRKEAFQVGAAAMQAAHAGSDEQAAQALEVLADARRRIYAILAEDEKTDA